MPDAQEGFRALFHKVEHVVKVAGVPVVGIWQRIASKKEMEFVEVLGRTDFAQVAQVGSVGGKNQVKAFEILRAHRACAQTGEVVTALGTVSDRAMIRR